MTTDRNSGTLEAIAEILGVLLLVGGWAAIVLACGELGGIWLAAIPVGLTAMWLGRGLASSPPSPPGGIPGGTRSGTPGGTPDRPEYIDPDADVPPDRYRRYRDLGQSGTDTGT